MIPQKLTPEELSFVTDKTDVIYLEIIKGMSLDELNSFNIYTPKDLLHYGKIQISWLQTEKHLIKNREGHDGEVSEEELISDMLHYHNGERFRVFYVLKYPNMVRRIEL